MQVVPAGKGGEEAVEVSYKKLNRSEAKEARKVISARRSASKSAVLTAEGGKHTVPEIVEAFASAFWSSSPKKWNGARWSSPRW